MLVAVAFAGDKAFANAVNQAFEHFLNLNARSPEYLSLFMDDKLRRGLKGMAEDDIEAVLDKAIMLFRFLQVGSGPRRRGRPAAAAAAAAGGGRAGCG